MGQNSTIGWCDHTFNPWIGCSKLSDGCKHCYAESQTYPRVSKARGLPLWGKYASRHRTSVDNWDGVLRWNRRAKKERENAEHEGRQHQRPRVFCASLADIFEDHPALHVWRADLWKLITSTEELDWMLLTKRPENIQSMVPPSWLAWGWPSHVWVGASCENQDAADRRIPHLLRVPAPVRFLSCEPLLGPIKIQLEYLAPFVDNDPGLRLTPRIDWVIAGGESGPNARPCQLEWIADIVAQCKDAGVPCFVKQLGSNAWDGGKRIKLSGKGGDPTEWPAACREWPREWPRKVV